MGYEDVSAAKKNEEEKKKSPQENLERFALREVEKFKQEHNRMPNKEEQDQIAETLYSQLKNADLNALYPEDKTNQIQAKQSTQSSRQERRARNQRGNEKQGPIQETTPQPTPPSTPQQNDIKSLLEADSTKPNEKKETDEFDLGLDEEDTNTQSGEKTSEPDDIENINLSDKEICPNCKKESENIIFCPKCGTAYCPNCAKKDGPAYICPKCGTKTKI
jgi:hypothetical protein